MINGQILKQAVISGANNISNQKNSINDLNIFPVPDGDTGTNMSMTVNAAVAALDDFDGTCAGDAAGAEKCTNPDRKQKQIHGISGNRLRL